MTPIELIFFILCCIAVANHLVTYFRELCILIYHFVIHTKPQPIVQGPKDLTAVTIIHDVPINSGDQANPSDDIRLSRIGKPPGSSGSPSTGKSPTSSESPEQSGPSDHLEIPDDLQLSTNSASTRNQAAKFQYKPNSQLLAVGENKTTGNRSIDVVVADVHQHEKATNNQDKACEDEGNVSIKKVKIESQHRTTTADKPIGIIVSDEKQETTLKVLMSNTGQAVNSSSKDKFHTSGDIKLNDKDKGASRCSTNLLIPSTPNSNNNSRKSSLSTKSMRNHKKGKRLPPRDVPSSKRLVSPVGNRSKRQSTKNTIPFPHGK